MEISDDGGVTWPLGANITGPQVDWELISISMGGYPDYYNSANFRMRFRLDADNDGNTGDGIFIDDVRIVEGAFRTARLSDLGLAAAGSADDQNYLLMNGTSMSTPLTAGAATLVRQYYTQELKRLRHDVQKAVSALPLSSKSLIAGRSSKDDVGNDMVIFHSRRASPKDLFASNMKRAQESVRVLEEFSKVLSRKSSRHFQALRFRLYQIEKKIALKL